MLSLLWLRVCRCDCECEYVSVWALWWTSHLSKVFPLPLAQNAGRPFCDPTEGKQFEEWMDGTERTENVTGRDQIMEYLDWESQNDRKIRQKLKE